MARSDEFTAHRRAIFSFQNNGKITFLYLSLSQRLFM